MKYFIGEVVRLIDGIDYDGNSLSYQEGFNVEITGVCDDGNYIVNDFYRSVNETEILKRVYSNEEKSKFYNFIKNVGKRVWVLKGESYHQVEIHHFSFKYEEYVSLDGFRLGKFPHFSELECWKSECLELREKLNQVSKSLNMVYKQ